MPSCTADAPSASAARMPRIVRNATGRDDRHFHRTHDLRQQCHRAGLARQVVAEEMAPMSARFPALGNHTVGAVFVQPAGLVDRGRTAQHEAAPTPSRGR